MSQRQFISRFTPSRTNPEFLEKILVQRHELLDDAVARVRESATTGNKHHLLFVGPRGSGKTNLVTLLFHRLDQQVDLRSRLRIAWLNEDETSTTFLDLLLRIYRALAKKYPTEFPLDALDPLYELDLSAATERIGQLLLAQLAARPLLLLVENLNDLFGALGDDGQKAWRAFLQNHPLFTIVATAQRLFDGVTRRTSPFFGFFQTEHLRALSVSEAITLLENIAALNNDRELGEYLRSRVGRARVRALHHLTGGNHRIYVVLSEFITRDSIDQLVGPFESMIDELTPYYQERIRWLAPLQRKIVEHLCSRAQPTPVKDIAKALFATHQTIASQLKALRGIGYVENHARGRESLYELSEPLMRLCVEVKENQQRKPLRLIVDFLRVWYDANKLEGRLATLDETAPERPYVIEALELLRTQKISLRVRYLLDDLERIGPDMESPDRLQCLRELVGERGDASDWCKLVSELTKNQAWDEAIKTVEQARESGAAKDPIAHGILAFFAGLALLQTNHADEAIKELTTALSSPGIPEAAVEMGLLLRSQAFTKLSKFEDVISDTTRLLDRLSVQDDSVFSPLGLRTSAFVRLGRLDDAILDCSRVIETVKDIDLLTSACALRGVLLFASGKFDQAFPDLSISIDRPSLGPIEKAKSLSLRSVIFMLRSLWSDAFNDLENLFVLWPKNGSKDEILVFPMIAAIFNSAQNDAGWAPKITELTRLFAKHDSLSILGDSLVRALPLLTKANLNEAGLDAWVSVWREAGAAHDAMTVPLRLLQTGVAYIKAKDEGVLLDLPKEERSILRQALNLPVEEGEP